MQFNLRSPTTQKYVIACTLVFGLAYGYANFVYVPRHEMAKKLTVDIRKETDLLNRGKRIAANFQTVQEDYARLMQSWDIARALLPTQREMEGLLKNIALAGQDRNVNFLLFRPLDPVEKPYYWENPIQIRTLSTYHALGEFLSDLAALDRIVNVNNLRLHSYKPNRGRSQQTVQAEFVVSIYIFKELGTPVGTLATDDNTPSGKPAVRAGARPAGESGPTPPAKMQSKPPAAGKDKRPQA